MLNVTHAHREIEHNVASFFLCRPWREGRRQGGYVYRRWTYHPFDNSIPDRIEERVKQVAGGGQRKRCGPSEPRANAAEIEPQKEGFYSDPSGARLYDL